MQIKKILVYGKNKKIREIDLEFNKLNIISGEEKTGKSVLGDIIDYCLGGEHCNIAEGVVRETSEWVGLLLQMDAEQIMIARKTPPLGKHSTNKFYFEMAINIEIPKETNFVENSTTEAIEKMLSKRLNIKENRNSFSTSQTKNSVSANIRHALFYCFQKQDEIAAKNFLFHRQQEDFITQSIKDTLPYFFGIIDEEYLKLENEKSILKKKILISKKNLEENLAIVGKGIEKAINLINEAKLVGLIEEELNVENEKLEVVTGVLKRVIKWEPQNYINNETEELHILQEKLENLRNKNSLLSEKIIRAEKFNMNTNEYDEELKIQKSRLSSIGLFEKLNFNENYCPFCSSEVKENLPNIQEMKKSLILLDKNISTISKEQPQIIKYINTLKNEKQIVNEKIKLVRAKVESLLYLIEDANNIKELNLRQAKVIGRISIWLESFDGIEFSSEDVNLDIANMQERLDEIELLLDKETINDNKLSILSKISADMSRWAKELELESNDYPYRLDMNKVTVVIDKNRPVPLKQLGSGSNWVGIHLIAYFALHKFFIENQRPVPRFLFIDQPSQVYFPNEAIGGNKESESVKKMYKFIMNKANELGLQVIVVDHFFDTAFENHLVEMWRNGKKLIPKEWYENQLN